MEARMVGVSQLEFSIVFGALLTYKKIQLLVIIEIKG